MALHILIAASSYASLLLLLLPTKMSGVIGTAIVFLFGFGLIIWKKPWMKESRRISQALVSGFMTVYLGYRFYMKWIPSSKVKTVAGMLHIPTCVFLGAVAIILTVFAVPAILYVLQKSLELREKSTGEKRLKDLFFFCSIVSCLIVVLSQLMIDVDLLSMGVIRFLCAVVVVSIVIALFYACCGNARISAFLGSCWFMVLSTANAYVYQFRGRLLEPIDVFSIGTAMNVAEHYSLWPVPINVILCWGIWCGAFFYLFPKNVKVNDRISGKSRIVILIGCIVAAIIMNSYATNLKTYHWDKEGAVFNGYVLDFVSKIKEAYIAEPDGYNCEDIESLSEQYPLIIDTPSETKHPHIIVIMDESFSDLSVQGDLSTDVEVMPFVSSLRQDAVTGYVLVSVFGGNTANSEFEFLTGNTMAWLSPNAVPYQQYMKPAAYSMVSYLKTNYHYHCIAMHPYISSGWNRPEAYADLGFDECHFIEDFPQKDLIRGLISDQEMFEKLIEIYEEQHQSPLFLFGVTMQNHGGYNYKGDDFDSSVLLTGYDGDYTDAEQYLSLIHESDKAVESLIGYFSNVDDDVIVVFFGDHQPRLNEAFFDELGKGVTSLDDQQKRYLVPFFIWANYDIEEKELDHISLNYLSTCVYEAANISLPPYNQFLSDMEATIPAINANGFYSLKEKHYLTFDMASKKESAWLDMYQQLQYNNLFDLKDRNKVFFPACHS